MHTISWLVEMTSNYFEVYTIDEDVPKLMSYISGCGSRAVDVSVDSLIIEVLVEKHCSQTGWCSNESSVLFLLLK